MWIHRGCCRVRVRPAFCEVVVAGAIDSEGQCGFEQRLDLGVTVDADRVWVDDLPRVAVAQDVACVQIAMDEHVVAAVAKQGA